LLIGCGDDDGDDDDDDSGRSDSGQISDAGGDAARPDGGMDASTNLDASTDASTNPDAGALTDNQVVGIVSAINAGEIQAGMVASMKATNSAVDSFAATMVTMHTQAQTSLTALNIPAAASAQQTMLMTQAATLKQMLDSTPAGAQFDLLYIESQVTMHNMALQLLDTMLISEAATPALRTELNTVRGQVQMHYNQAVQIRNQLSSDGGAGDGGTAADAGGMDASG
jgi:predicted outer membrane protein